MLYVILSITLLLPFRYIRMMEESPDEYFRWKNEDFWLSMVQTVSEFIGSDPQNVVFVQNTTTGLTVL